MHFFAQWNLLLLILLPHKLPVARRKDVGGSESKQRQRGSRRTNNSPGRRNTAVPQVNSPSDLDCAGKAARRVLSGRRCIYLASVRMDSWTHGLFAFATQCKQTGHTQHKQASKKNVHCAGFLIANAVVDVRVVLCI